MSRIKVLINGAAGKVGREVIKAVLADPELELIGAVDIACSGQDAAQLAGLPAGGSGNSVKISNDLAQALKTTGPDVAVDFTQPSCALANVKTIINSKVAAVVGTTGLSQNDLTEIGKLAEEKGVPVLVAPNFAIGAVLMMLFAAQAAKFMKGGEIIELHHDQKADAPSGTAIKTAEMMAKNKGAFFTTAKKSEEKISGVRGGEMSGIHIHSVRLPGLVAHQEVIFGEKGQTLTIRHDSLNRESFMPGLVMAIKKITQHKGLVYGLENLLDF